MYYNLRNSFLQKSDKEIRSIRKKFYKNFCDYLVEYIRLFNTRSNFLDKVFTYENMELLEVSKKNQKNVMLLSGHLFNWELYTSLAKDLPQQKRFSLYKYIRNDFWNEKILKVRTQNGVKPIEMGIAPKFVLQCPADGDHVVLFVADQSPFKDDIRYDLKFLNQRTPVFYGYEVLARKREMDVYFMETSKVGRGKYHTKFIKIVPDNGSAFEEKEIVHKFFNLLEKAIEKQPENWLWTHKRWKYKKGIHY